MDLGGYLGEKPLGLVGDIALNPEENFLDGFGLVGQAVKQFGGGNQRMAGGAMDDFLGFSSGGYPLGGIVGMAMQFPSDEIGKIIADAQGGIQRATGILEDKARGYRADAEANQALLGLIPAGITA